MPIFNVCIECGCKIQIESPSDPLLKQSLESSKNAVCHDCDSFSNWKKVDVLVGSGYINGWKYQEIYTEYGPGLLLSYGKKDIYFPPLASKKELLMALNSLPTHIKGKVIHHQVFNFKKQT